MFVWGRGAGIVRQGPSVLAVVAGCVCLFVFFCFFFVGGGGGYNYFFLYSRRHNIL